MPEELALGALARANAGTSIDPQSRMELTHYDFRRPHRVSKERLRTLEAMYGRLVQSLEGWLMGRVRGQIELKLQSIEQLSFGEFQATLETPCAAYIFDIEDSGNQQGVVNFGNDFSYFLVDRLFGGSGATTMMHRALTPMERLAIRVVAARVTQITQEIWADHVPMKLDLTGFESIPEILRASNREDPVLVAYVDVSAAAAQSRMMICLPFAVLDKFFSAGPRRINEATGSEAELAHNREVAERSLRSTRVTVSARLPELRLPMREIASLSVGRVIFTGMSRTADLNVHVGPQLRFKAMVGRVNGNLAIRITDTVAEPAPPVSGAGSHSHSRD
jgi:flagellar motor switch protein FliM